MSRTQAAPRFEIPDPKSAGPGRGPLIIVGSIVALIVVAAVVAIILTGGGDSSPATIESGAASPAGELGGSSGAALGLQDPQVAGVALPLFETVQGDPAVGRQAPIASGTDFDGNPVELHSTGKPTAIVFLAHWCPHCQREVKDLGTWLSEGSLPDDVALLSVATSINPDRPNYPPDEWLAREKWAPPVLVDTTGAVAEAYGLSAFPYWVFLNADGTVAARATGEMSTATLEQVLAGLKR